MLPFIRFLIIFVVFSKLLIFQVLAVSKIGVIVPIEHQSMEQIISGIREVFEDTATEIIVKNAHGDLNITSALIKQMRDNDEIKIVMPIGTSTSQVALATIKDKFVVLVAAKITNLSNPLVTGVNDEILISESIKKLKHLRKIAVIYSANEKVIDEVEELKNYAQKNNIELHLSMIQNLTDLPSAVKSLHKDVDSFLILKDHLIASGINIIIKEARARSIPLIASDEGSVLAGATIAIGVEEKDIGLESGKMAKLILEGKNPVDIKYKMMDKLSLFINKKAFKEQNILTLPMLDELELNKKIIK